MWLGALGVMLLLVALRDSAPWLITYPETLFWPVVSFLNAGMAWVADYTGAFFRAIPAALHSPMSAVRDVLGWLPWSVAAFAYLLANLLLFGFGAVVGLIAGILFAFPPMVRNTMPGLRRVAPEVI